MARKTLIIIIFSVLLLITSHKSQARMGSSSIGATAVDHTNGARVVSVSSSGRASRFGLRQGDIVLSINSQTVKDAESFFQLMTGVPQGDAVSIKVVRNDVETTVGRTRITGGRGMGRGGSNRTTDFVKNYDKDGNGWLDTEERNSARRPSGNQTSVTYNPMLTPSDVTWYSD
ncbi:PDZ domain-containing protein, partial [Planctomycetota bacterium]